MEANSTFYVIYAENKNYSCDGGGTMYTRIIQGVQQYWIHLVANSKQFMEELRHFGQVLADKIANRMDQYCWTPCSCQLYTTQNWTVLIKWMWKR